MYLEAASFSKALPAAGAYRDVEDLGPDRRVRAGRARAPPSGVREVRAEDNAKHRRAGEETPRDHKRRSGSAGGRPQWYA
eukprot:CAMPEP_0174890340 /NCGR_PEP_ID=MMETSP0167-20121228/5501_1 /TAXON_ID=38298 /ORGANISM="Rhodella maculata, Strain CCMP736" /LENGTH=79 /DNA_ID=CAMNT_0016128117 /DNA_START=605 /DNA_END=845 /DNA_ORIENTATION=-